MNVNNSHLCQEIKLLLSLGRYAFAPQVQSTARTASPSQALHWRFVAVQLYVWQDSILSGAVLCIIRFHAPPIRLALQLVVAAFPEAMATQLEAVCFLLVVYRQPLAPPG